MICVVRNYVGPITNGRESHGVIAHANEIFFHEKTDF